MGKYERREIKDARGERIEERKRDEGWNSMEKPAGEKGRKKEGRKEGRKRKRKEEGIKERPNSRPSPPH